MRKDITICFRTSKELRKSLEEVAREERRSLSALIQNALHDFVNQKKSLPSGKEKRRHPRKEVFLPTLASLVGTEGLHAGVILDISLGGLRLSVPKEYDFDIQKDDETARINILFTLPAEKSTVALKCKPNRIRQTNGETEVAVAFSDCDFPSYQKVQNYLLQ
jgi:hypothetical protein